MEKRYQKYEAWQVAAAVCAVIRDGSTVKQAAERYGVCPKSLYNWMCESQIARREAHKNKKGISTNNSKISREATRIVDAAITALNTLRDEWGKP